MRGTFILTLFSVLIAGCGISVTRQHVANGLVVGESITDVGFASAKSTYKTYTPVMPVCVAGIGEMPDNEQIALCQERIRRGETRTNDQLDWQASPYGMYGYGQYRRFQ